MSEERRISDRVTTSTGDVQVRDRIGNTSLGSIANLSRTGFMLVSDRLIEAESVFQLELISSNQNEIILLGAVCLWNADTSSENLYWNGFQIIDISVQTEAALEQLISSLAD